jgi:transposase InsO family protein
VPTWVGVAYVCFISDAYSRMIVGWRDAAHMRTEMVLDALEMARWARGTRLEGLVAHSDAGSQTSSPAANDSPRSTPCPRSARSATSHDTLWPRA